MRFSSMQASAVVKRQSTLAWRAYWLMLTVRDAIPRPRDLATAEFATLKVAARVVETASCPEAELFRSLPSALWPSAP